MRRMRLDLRSATPAKAPLLRRARHLAARAWLRPGRRRRRGQTTVEFAFAFVLMLMLVFGSASAGLWSIEEMGAISAEETAARVAAGATGVNQGFADKTNLAAAVAQAAGPLKSSIFGAKITTATSGCKTTPGVPANSIVVCAEVNVPAAGYVTVTVEGCAGTLIPVFGLGGAPGGCPKGGVPINNIAVIHQLIFQG